MVTSLILLVLLSSELLPCTVLPEPTMAIWLRVLGWLDVPPAPASMVLLLPLYGDVLHHIVFDILFQGVAAASHVHTGQRIGGILIRYGSDRILIPGNTTLTMEPQLPLMALLLPSPYTLLPVTVLFWPMAVESVL